MNIQDSYMLRPILLLLLLHSSSCQLSMVLDSLLSYYQQSVNNPDRYIPDISEFSDHYDFIVIGGGTGGSVVANRLSEIPGWSILLLELGNDENFLSDIPLASNFIVTTSLARRYRATPNPNACQSMAGKSCIYMRGQALGGSSVVNYMVYTRGSKRDYDNWEALGNEGWSYVDLLPYFKKSENVHVPGLENSEERSRGGNLWVQNPPWRSPLASAFLDAGVEMGYNITDISARTQLGFSYPQATIREGKRFSAANAFLRPVRKRPNLHIAKGARVTRILFDMPACQAVGVEFVKGGRTFVVRASKEVILSAGTMGSAHLLMLSGIGPREHLEDLDIQVIQDLKVGHNLQEHVTLPGLSFTVNDTVTLVESRMLLDPRPVLDYVIRQTGPLTMAGGADALAFVKTKYSSDMDDPDVELVLVPATLSGALTASFLEAMGLPGKQTRIIYKNIQGKDSYSIMPILLNPKSRGVIRLKSKESLDSPLVDYNYFDNKEDLKRLIEGVKIAVAISGTRALQRYASLINKEPFPGCEQHGFHSDAYWTCSAQQFTLSLQHQVGTCKMGPESDPNAVVDAQLRVRGIRGLRVVDASIMPVIPKAHTMAPVYMIAEKASDMIKNSWIFNKNEQL